MHARVRPSSAIAHLVASEPAARYRAKPALVSHDEGDAGWPRIANDVAERWVDAGVDPDYLARLSAAACIEPRLLYEFVGLDRTTVGRRKAAGAALPHEAAVKALQATELMAQAAEVFGGAEPAGRWMTSPHPLLDGATPLRRARTPWGLDKVRGMLVALRHGGAV